MASSSWALQSTLIRVSILSGKAVRLQMAPFVCPATSWSFDREHVCTQGCDDDFDIARVLWLHRVNHLYDGKEWEKRPCTWPLIASNYFCHFYLELFTSFCPCISYMSLHSPRTDAGVQPHLHMPMRSRGLPPTSSQVHLQRPHHRLVTRQHFTTTSKQAQPDRTRTSIAQPTNRQATK